MPGMLECRPLTGPGPLMRVAVRCTGVCVRGRKRTRRMLLPFPLTRPLRWPVWVLWDRMGRRVSRLWSAGRPTVDSSCNVKCPLWLQSGRCEKHRCNFNPVLTSPRHTSSRQQRAMALAVNFSHISNHLQVA